MASGSWVSATNHERQVLVPQRVHGFNYAVSSVSAGNFHQHSSGGFHRRSIHDLRTTTHGLEGGEAYIGGA